eukprot:comp18014_c0_seq1/m.31438 comp18014_c0_seq1/g.31438  ORF comp18014_c0_seq1/g.31438 comp18014_c0_seq1/m.31438 type:complete len:316 (+) comp18014_c0_seq1:191-1138(+)
MRRRASAESGSGSGPRSQCGVPQVPAARKACRRARRHIARQRLRAVRPHVLAAQVCGPARLPPGRHGKCRACRGQAQSRRTLVQFPAAGPRANLRHNGPALAGQQSRNRACVQGAARPANEGMLAAHHLRAGHHRGACTAGAHQKGENRRGPPQAGSDAKAEKGPACAQRRPCLAAGCNPDRRREPRNNAGARSAADNGAHADQHHERRAGGAQAGAGNGKVCQRCRKHSSAGRGQGAADDDQARSLAPRAQHVLGQADDAAVCMLGPRRHCVRDRKSQPQQPRQGHPARAQHNQGVPVRCRLGPAQAERRQQRQ